MLFLPLLLEVVAAVAVVVVVVPFRFCWVCTMEAASGMLWGIHLAPL